MAEVKIWYDKDADFLEITFEDAPASLEEIEEDIYERRTPDGKIIGFAVLNMTKHDRDGLTLPLHMTAIETPMP